MPDFFFLFIYLCFRIQKPQEVWIDAMVCIFVFCLRLRFKNHKSCGLMLQFVYIFHFELKIPKKKERWIDAMVCKKKSVLCYKIQKTQELWIDGPVCTYYYILLCFYS